MGMDEEGGASVVHNVLYQKPYHVFDHLKLFVVTTVYKTSCDT